MRTQTITVELPEGTAPFFGGDNYAGYTVVKAEPAVRVPDRIRLTVEITFDKREGPGEPSNATDATIESHIHGMLMGSRPASPLMHPDIRHVNVQVKDRQIITGRP